MINVNIDKFQGPLSLLLQIIEKEEMDITSVNLAKIADEYLEYVKNYKDILPESMADFLLMAAKLLYIKSRALLPYLFSDEDQSELEDLESKLKMYKEFVDLSWKVQKIIGRKKFSFFRDVPKKSKKLNFLEPSFFPPQNISSIILRDDFLRILLKVELLEERLEKKIIESEVSIEDRIFFIKELVAQRVKINFSKIMKEARSKTEIVVNFLAVLELAKQREIIFNQDDLFGEIFIETYRDV